jgi:hypothetical protein
VESRVWTISAPAPIAPKFALHSHTRARGVAGRLALMHTPKVDPSGEPGCLMALASARPILPPSLNRPFRGASKWQSPASPPGLFTGSDAMAGRSQRQRFAGRTRRPTAT